MDAEDEAELQAALAIEELQDLLWQTGWKKPISTTTVTDKSDIITTMIRYHLLVKVKGPMDQFVDGMLALDLAQRVKQNPSLWEPLFTAKHEYITIGECFIAKISI